MFSSQNSQVSSDANYIEDMFSTYLYTGNATDRTITNGIDLSTKGGLVWTKTRDATRNNCLADTVSGQNSLASNLTTTPSYGGTGTVLSYNTNGYNIGTSDVVNLSSYNIVSWTFRKQPKFFDIVTTTSQTFSHSLASVAGCVIWKRTDASEDWNVVSRKSDGSYVQLNLNLTDGAFASYANAAAAGITSTTITLPSFTTGGTYVAYLFAHDAGGFGASGSDNVITCGSWSTTNVGGRYDAIIDLGWEPQWVLFKPTNNTGNWQIYDNMRGWTANSAGNNVCQRLYPSLSNPEDTDTNTQLQYDGVGKIRLAVGASGYEGIYIAIRRGPMKVPLDATKVFGAETWTGNAASPRTFTSSNWTFPADLVTVKGTNNSAWWNQWSPRLTGGTLSTNDTGAEQTSSTSIAGYVSSFNQTGYTATSGSSSISNYNANSDTYVSYNLRRAPSFMDVVCYTGTGSVRTINHNLGVAPELMIVKCRSGNLDWTTYQAPLGANQVMRLNSTIAAFTDASVWNGTAPTSSVFSVGTSIRSNSGGDTFVIYLFATCPGVSKVGSYTGTGALQTINCGFTSGARFVMIKRTDSTGDWFYYDSVRGITSGNDPYLLFNSSNQQVTNTNFVDTDSTGFKVTASAPAEMNASGGTYIFLAIA